MHCVKTAVRVAVTPSRHSGSITAYMISYRYGRPQRGEGLNVQVVYNKKMSVRYAAVTTTIRLRFDGRSTRVRLLIKGH